MTMIDLEMYGDLERARKAMAAPRDWWPAEAKAEATALEAELYEAEESLLVSDGGTPCANC